jgi:hypothetical protein
MWNITACFKHLDREKWKTVAIKPRMVGETSLQTGVYCYGSGLSSEFYFTETSVTRISGYSWFH